MARPRHDTDAERVYERQVAYSLLGPLRAVSALTGQPLNARASAYFLWHRSIIRGELAPAARLEGLEGPMKLQRDEGELQKKRDQAIDEIRRELTGRARGHLKRARKKKTVFGLRMLSGTTTGGPGGHYIEAMPGLFSEQWAVPIGKARGEPRLDQAEALVAREPKRFEIVELTVEELSRYRPETQAGAGP